MMLLKYLMKQTQIEIISMIFKNFFNSKFYRKKTIVYIIFRIEEEEVDSYKIFDQNKDGIVSQDERDVSNYTS